MGASVVRLWVLLARKTGPRIKGPGVTSDESEADTRIKGPGVTSDESEADTRAEAWTSEADTRIKENNVCATYDLSKFACNGR